MNTFSELSFLELPSLRGQNISDLFSLAETRNRPINQLNLFIYCVNQNLRQTFYLKKNRFPVPRDITIWCCSKGSTAIITVRRRQQFKIRGGWGWEGIQGSNYVPLVVLEVVVGCEKGVDG